MGEQGREDVRSAGSALHGRFRSEWEAWFTKLIGMEGEMPSVPGATPSQPAETAPPAAGPIVQTDRVVTQSSNATALTATGSAAALIAGACVVLVARRRRAMR